MEAQWSSPWEDPGDRPAEVLNVAETGVYPTSPVLAEDEPAWDTIATSPTVPYDVLNNKAEDRTLLSTKFENAPPSVSTSDHRPVSEDAEEDDFGEFGEVNTLDDELRHEIDVALLAAFPQEVAWVDYDGRILPTPKSNNLWDRLENVISPSGTWDDNHVRVRFHGSQIESETKKIISHWRRRQLPVGPKKGSLVPASSIFGWDKEQKPSMSLADIYKKPSVGKNQNRRGSSAKAKSSDLVREEIISHKPSADLRSGRVMTAGIASLPGNNDDRNQTSDWRHDPVPTEHFAAGDIKATTTDVEISTSKNANGELLPISTASDRPSTDLSYPSPFASPLLHQSPRSAQPPQPPRSAKPPQPPVPHQPPATSNLNQHNVKENSLEVHGRDKNGSVGSIEFSAQKEQPSMGMEPEDEFEDDTFGEFVGSPSLEDDHSDHLPSPRPETENLSPMIASPTLGLEITTTGLDHSQGQPAFQHFPLSPLSPISSLPPSTKTGKVVQPKLSYDAVLSPKHTHPNSALSEDRSEVAIHSDGGRREGSFSSPSAMESKEPPMTMTIGSPELEEHGGDQSQPEPASSKKSEEEPAWDFSIFERQIKPQSSTLTSSHERQQDPAIQSILDRLPNLSHLIT